MCASLTAVWGNVAPTSSPMERAVLLVPCMDEDGEKALMDATSPSRRREVDNFIVYIEGSEYE